MLRFMYSGISGMKVNQNKLDVIGNNIANVGTTAFKSSRAEFSDMLYQNSGEASAPTSDKGGVNAKQVGLGAKLSSINKVMGQGNALSTGRSLDVCVDKEGYLIVASGPVDGDIKTADDTNHTIATGTKPMSKVLYTRDGNFSLDQDGNLLTQDGYRVMGYAMAGETFDTTTTPGVKVISVAPGASNTLKADFTKLVPLVIPDKVGTDPISKFEIGQDGTITAVLGGGSKVMIGQVAMASFKNPEGLTAIGSNKLDVSSNSGDTIVRSGRLATNNNSGGFGDIVQGCLEASNVDLTEQFTDMISATRSFQAASKLISTGDEILQTITGLMR